MNEFRTDHYTRKLFEEAGEQCERDDEWSYPKGIFIGGMIELAECDQVEYARQYFSAAETIANLVNKNVVADYAVSAPIFFLYRHALELYLKAIANKQSGSFRNNEHSLHILSGDVNHLSDWARRRLQELNGYDKKSTSFRYGGHKAFDEKWAELSFFTEAMSCLKQHLEEIYSRSLRHE